jgi:hypothetical protein
VAAQMSASLARDGFGCGADAGGGWTLSRCSGGQGMGGYEPSPVMSDERSPKTQMRAYYTGEPYEAQHTRVHETCPPSGRKANMPRATITVPRV